MKITTVCACIWLSVAFAVGVGIYITKSASPLWTFLIPACIRIKEE